MFKQAKHNRAFEDVVAQIQERILEGSLGAGDRLPSERQLQEIFQVSRNTLREALRTLEQKGLITIKTGVKGGAIVSPVDTRWVTEGLDLLLQYQKISLRELAEFREEIEGLVAAKAARMAKKNEIEKLKTLVKSIAHCLPLGDKGWDEISELDTTFHLSLARIIGNRMYESVLNTVHDNINRYFHRFLTKNPMVFKNVYQELCKITEAIEKRDSDGAREALQEHVRRYSRMMKKEEERRKGQPADAQLNP